MRQGVWHNAQTCLGVGRKGSTCNLGLAKKERNGTYTIFAENELGEVAAKRRRELQECEFQKGTVATRATKSDCTALSFSVECGDGGARVGRQYGKG